MHPREVCHSGRWIYRTLLSLSFARNIRQAMQSMLETMPVFLFDQLELWSSAAVCVAVHGRFHGEIIVAVVRKRNNATICSSLGVSCTDT